MKSGLVMKSAVAAIGMAVAVGFAGVANAGPLPLYPITQLEDNDLDALTLDLNNNGKLDVGDQLSAIFKFQGINQLPSGSTYIPKELTGYSRIEVATKSDDLNPDPDVETYAISFKPAASFEADYGAGAMAILFYDAADNLAINGCTTLASCLAVAIDGTEWATVGFNGDVNEKWAYIGTDNVAAATTEDASTAVANINFGINVLENYTGYDILPKDCSVITTCNPGGDGKVQVVGGLVIRGGDGLDHSNVLHVRSDLDMQIETNAIPEPASLALIGVGLLAGFAGKRRRQ